MKDKTKKKGLFLLDGFVDNLKEMRGFLNKLSAILFFGLLAFPISAFCQVDTAWVRYYNGTGDKVDEIVSFAVDDSGNAVVTGYSGSFPSTWDIVTIRYDRNGNQLWRQNYSGIQYNQNWPNSLSLDKSGNVYIIGGKGTNCITLKYDSNGNLIWQALYLNEAAIGDAVATDENSNVYVTAYSGSSYPNIDCLTLKYDSNGNQLWANVFNKGLNYFDRSYLIAPDKNGNVYVSGYSENRVTGG